LQRGRRTFLSPNAMHKNEVGVSISWSTHRGTKLKIKSLSQSAATAFKLQGKWERERGNGVTHSQHHLFGKETGSCLRLFARTEEKKGRKRAEPTMQISLFACHQIRVGDGVELFLEKVRPMAAREGGEPAKKVSRAASPPLGNRTSGKSKFRSSS